MTILNLFCTVGVTRLWSSATRDSETTFLCDDWIMPVGSDEETMPSPPTP